MATHRNQVIPMQARVDNFSTVIQIYPPKKIAQNRTPRVDRRNIRLHSASHIHAHRGKEDDRILAKCVHLPSHVWPNVLI